MGAQRRWELNPPPPAAEAGGLQLGHDDASQTTPMASPALVCAGALCQRDPAMFSGTDDDDVEDCDVEDWLSSYERVNAHKRDDTTKLTNVVFY